MIKTNFHTHTYRCLHADGSEEDYIAEAIKCGFSELGISDHGPEPTNTIGYRMLWEDIDDYLNTLTELKKKYSGKIKVYSGFEYEYMRNDLPFLKEVKARDDVDYFALGPHSFLDDRGERHDSFFLKDKDEFIPYAKAIVEAMETGLYSFVAHPDLYVYTMKYHCKEADEAARIIAKASLETGIPLEINANGMRRGVFNWDGVERYLYPYWRFWDKVAEVGAKVIIGSDAHSPEFLCDSFFVESEKFAAEHGIIPVEFTGEML